MELVQCRMVTDDVEGLAGFYAGLLAVPADPERVLRRDRGRAGLGGFLPAEVHRVPGARVPRRRQGRDEIILDFLVDDVDAEYPRIAALGVEWVMPPTTQPWGNRSMVFRDPAGNLVNVFSRPDE